MRQNGDMLNCTEQTLFTSCGGTKPLVSYFCIYSK